LRREFGGGGGGDDDDDDNNSNNNNNNVHSFPLMFFLWLTFKRIF
jgi:hypothetical protein